MAQLLTFIVDLTVSIDIRLSDHFVHFLICQLLAQIGHDVTELGCTDVAVSILRREYYASSHIRFFCGGNVLEMLLFPTKVRLK